MSGRSHRALAGPAERRHVAGLVGGLALCLVIAAAGTALAASRALPQTEPVVAPAVSPLPPPPGTTERVSVGDGEQQANGPSGGVSAILTAMNGDQAISADGRWVAFASAAANLIPGEAHPAGGVFLRDRQSNATVAIPWVDGKAFPGGLSAVEPAISADGVVVAFTVISNGSNRAVGLPADSPFVYAWDGKTGLTELVSMDANLRPTPGYQPSISADGFHVAYTQWFVQATPPPTTAPPPDTSPPRLFGMSANPTCIDNGTPSSVISVNAADDRGLASVTINYQRPGDITVFTVPMSNTSGALWQGTIQKDFLWQTYGYVNYWVVAVDTSGNTATLDDDPLSDRNRLTYAPDGCPVFL